MLAWNSWGRQFPVRELWGGGWVGIAFTNPQHRSWELRSVQGNRALWTQHMWAPRSAKDAETAELGVHGAGRFLVVPSVLDPT